MRDLVRLGGHGEMTIKVFAGQIDYVEMTRKAKTEDEIRHL